MHHYDGDAIVYITHGVLYLKHQVSNVMTGFLYVPPDLEAAYGGQFCPSMTGEFEPVKLGINVEVPQQGTHVFSPPFCFFHKEGTFCHSVVSVKDGVI